MKDKIIKALECISGEEVYCEECSYSALYRYNFCIKRCAKDAIELINRLKRQCNKYRNKVQAQAGELRRLYKQNAEYKAEIERLTKIVEEQHEGSLIAMEVYKNEAIKEFAERLKEQLGNLEYRAKTKRKTVSVDFLDSQMNWVLHEVSAETIDNLVKEMVGDA